MTLARFNRRAGAPPLSLDHLAGVSSLPEPVGYFLLFESHLTPQGAHHEVIHHYPLSR
nr:hypothetical protein [uncultured Sphingomonas sp.]